MSREDRLQAPPQGRSLHSSPPRVTGVSAPGGEMTMKRFSWTASLALFLAGLLGACASGKTFVMKPPATKVTSTTLTIIEEGSTVEMPQEERAAMQKRLEDRLYAKDGFVKLKLFSDFPDRFLNLKKVYIDFWGDKKKFIVEDVNDLKGKIIIKFKKFDSPRDSQVLIDREIYVDEKDAVSLPDNHFFVHDLIGSEVVVEKEIIGTISEVIKGKANDVIVISTDEKKEILVPFVLNFIEKFDAAKKRLILNISKDFLEDDED